LPPSLTAQPTPFTACSGTITSVPASCATVTMITVLLCRQACVIVGPTLGTPDGIAVMLSPPLDARTFAAPPPLPHALTRFSSTPR
jgi:hypothetical protein